MRARRRTAVVLSGLLLIAGCSGGGSSGETSPSDTATTNSDGTTKAGTTLTIGDPAVVSFSPAKGAASKVRLTVTSVKKGSTKDLKQFQLNPEAKASSVYYVKVALKNVGNHDIGGSPVVLYGKVSQSLVVQPVQFGSTFAKCSGGPLPKPFGHGKKAAECLVMLAPHRGTISEIQWRMDTEAPIVWTVPGKG